MFGNVRLIDLSVPLEHDAVSEPLRPRIHYVSHEGEGLRQQDAPATGSGVSLEESLDLHRRVGDLLPVRPDGCSDKQGEYPGRSAVGHGGEHYHVPVVNALSGAL